MHTTTDKLDPRALTWERGISLEPLTPRLRESIAAVYRQYALNAKSAVERAHAVEQAEKWGTP
jgi:hypothetical protein